MRHLVAYGCHIEFSLEVPQVRQLKVELLRCDARARPVQTQGYTPFIIRKNRRPFEEVSPSMRAAVERSCRKTATLFSSEGLR